MIEAGRLRHRITIQQKTETQDETTGEVTETWSTFVSRVPAAFEPLSTKDFIAAKSEQGQVSARVIIRYRSGVTSSMRIIHGSTTYTIEGQPLPDKDSGREYLTLMVAEVVE